MSNIILHRACNYANHMAKTDETDYDIIWRAKEFLDKCGFEHGGIETVEVDNADWDCEAYYIHTGTTYLETVVCEGGECFVSSVGQWMDDAEKEYCEKHDKIRCGNCSDFIDFNYGTDDPEFKECDCGHYVGGGTIPEYGTQLNDCEELINYDSEVLWICNTQLPTHATKSRYTTLVVRLMFTDEYDSEWAAENGKYHVELLAVTPGIVGKKERESLFSSFDINETDWNEYDNDVKCEYCIQYGYSACLWQNTSNDSNSLLVEVEKQRQTALILGGFMLARSQNAIGSTGWDFMKGKL